VRFAHDGELERHNPCRSPWSAAALSNAWPTPGLVVARTYHDIAGSSRSAVRQHGHVDVAGRWSSPRDEQ